MKLLFSLFSVMVLGTGIAQTCNKLNHNCSNTTGLNTSGVTSSVGSIYACGPFDNVLYTTSSNAYIATDDIFIDEGNAATLHFDAKRATSYFGTGEVWVHIGGYCSFQMLTVPFNDNGWVQIGTFSPNTTCTNFGAYTVPSEMAGGQNISFCIVPDNASSSSWVAIDNICVSEISGSAVATTMYEDFGTSSSGWYPNSGVDDIPYHTYKNASDAYTLLSFGADGGSDKAAYFYTGFDFCSTVSGVGITTKEINTSGYSNGEIRVEFKSKYPCSGSNGYTFDENYQSYSPEISVMVGPDNGFNTWTQLPVNYYFADYNWRVASYDISAYQSSNVRFKIERGGFCGTAMEAVDNIKVLDRDCSISQESCGTITGEAAPIQNTDYAYSVPAVTGATYYKWFVRHDGNLYDTAPYIVSGQGTQTPTINFQSLPGSGVRVLCIPYDADPGVDDDACYAQIGILSVTVSAAVPLTVDNVIALDPICSGNCDGEIDLDVSGGVPPYTYDWVPNVSSTDFANGLCSNNYQITITDANLDQIVENVTLTDPAPFVATCGSPPAICAGDTVQLDPGLSGGTMPYSVVWTPATNISDPNVEMPLVWPSSSTNYDMTATDANGCITTCSVVAVTVNPLPEPNFSGSTTSGCAPLAVTFNPIPVGGGTICAWDFGDGNVDTLCSTVFNLYTAAGDYDVTLTMTDANGCVGDTTFVDLITVIATPSVGAGNDTTICEGDMITLTANNPDAATISWDNGITDGVAFTPTMDTIYVVTADNLGCIATDTTEVLIQALPIIDLGTDTATCEAFVNLDAGAGWDSYLWSNTQTTQTISATSSGDYWATVEDNGCFASDTLNVNLLDCTGFVDLNGAEVTIYPNPTNGLISVQGLPQNAIYMISAVDGRLLFEGVWNDSKSTIDLTDYTPGTYMLFFEYQGSSDVIRIIKH